MIKLSLYLLMIMRILVVYIYKDFFIYMSTIMHPQVGYPHIDVQYTNNMYPKQSEPQVIFVERDPLFRCFRTM